MRLTKNKFTQFILVIVTLLICTGLWELFIRIAQIDAFLLPAPSTILQHFFHLLQEEVFWSDTFTTLSEVLLGFAFSIFIAILVAPFISQFLVLELSLLPYIIGFQAIPSIALAPLFFIWLGPGIESKVLLVFTVAAFPIMMMLIVGLQSSSPDQIQMLRSFGATRLQILKKVQVPNALPHFFAGLRLGIIMSVTGAVVAEFQGAEAGLGYRVLLSYDQFLIADAFAYILSLSIIGIVLHALIGKLRGYVVFWDNVQKQHL